MVRLALSSVPRRGLVAGAVLCVPLTAVTAFAAALTIAPARLTSTSAATTVPPTTCSVPASHDTYASSLLLLSTFGTETELQVRSGAETKRAFVRFNLASCSIPTTAEVKTAKLRLSLVTSPSQSRTYRAHRITSDWAEGTLAWSGQPSIAATDTVSVATGTSAGALEWPVTPDVQGFVGDPPTANFGWRISDSVEGSLTTFQGAFTSKEGAGTVPELVVTYFP